MQSSSIIRRWIRGSLLITVLVLAIAEGLFLYYSYNDLYGGVERAMESRFSTVVGRLQATGTAGNTATTAESRGQALRRVVEQFDEKDKFEFMLLDGQGVILATGGFSSNVEMRETQVPYLTADLPTTNIKAASTGEGIYLAQAIGANTTQMSNIQRYPWADPNTGVLDKYAVWPFTGPSYGVIYVDYNGNRYVNEGDRRDVCANAAVNTGFVSTYAIFTEPVVAGYVRPEEIEAGIADGRILKADTLDELAEKINGFEVKGLYPTVTGENLKATIEKHNSYIDDGVDLDFGKVMASTMVKIEEGPYYALPQFPSVHHTMGGLVIDTMTQVIDIYGQPIAGLYAAGEVTGGVHGTNRLGSNADADACGFGYISGIVVSTDELPDFIPAE